jgi:hypothetical protein
MRKTFLDSRMKKPQKWFENYQWKDPKTDTKYLPEWENFDKNVCECPTAKIKFFWDVMPCRLITKFPKCNQLQDEAVFSSRTAPRWCSMHCDHSMRQSTQHISQKTWIVSNTSVRTSSLACSISFFYYFLMIRLSIVTITSSRNCSKSREQLNNSDLHVHNFSV